jgi:hypothetical protein
MRNALPSSTALGLGSGLIIENLAVSDQQSAVSSQQSAISSQQSAISQTPELLTQRALIRLPFRKLRVAQGRLRKPEEENLQTYAKSM